MLSGLRLSLLHPFEGCVRKPTSALIPATTRMLSTAPAATEVCNGQVGEIRLFCCQDVVKPTDEAAWCGSRLNPGGDFQATIPTEANIPPHHDNRGSSPPTKTYGTGRRKTSVARGKGNWMVGKPPRVFGCYVSWQTALTYFFTSSIRQL